MTMLLNGAVIRDDYVMMMTLVTLQKRNFTAI